MLSNFLLHPLMILPYFAALFVAITIHEYAHAATADHLGDPTARLAGRKTLNPLAHLDPLGTIALLLFHLGWGKPVPVDPFNFRKPRRDEALVSLSGPASNLIFAIILSILLRMGILFGLTSLNYLLASILGPLIVFSVMLGIFNLLPLHPLDGAHILLGILPEKLAREWEQILSQYSIIILVFLLLPFTGVSPVVAILSPIINFILSLLLPGGMGLMI